MLDREVGLTGKGPDDAAQIPPAGEARVERQRTVDQPDHRTEILAQLSQYIGSVGEDARVVLRHLERLPSEVDGLAAECLRLANPAVTDELHVAERRPDQCRPVMPINRE